MQYVSVKECNSTKPWSTRGSVFSISFFVQRILEALFGGLAACVALLAELIVSILAVQGGLDDSLMANRTKCSSIYVALRNSRPEPLFFQAI